MQVLIQRKHTVQCCKGTFILSNFTGKNANNSNRSCTCLGSLGITTYYKKRQSAMLQRNIYTWAILLERMPTMALALAPWALQQYIIRKHKVQCCKGAYLPELARMPALVTVVVLSLAPWALQQHIIIKEFLSRINQVDYWRSFCTTHEHYNYLQLIKLIKIKMVSIYKR